MSARVKLSSLEFVNLSMKKILIPFFLITIGLISTNCTDDNIEELTLSKGIEEEMIDTTKTITFSGDVLSIVENDCTPCHVDGGSQPNFTNYNTFNSKADAILTRINSGNMPKGGPKLSDNKILTIKTWIDAGKKDN